MAKNQGHIIRLGLFVSVGILVFIMAIYYIGNRQNLFSETYRISSVFPNVNGLQPGNNVRYGGINVGTVDKVLIVSDSTMQVVMKLEEASRIYIKKDAVASIGTDGLVGNMVVDINRGDSALPAVEDGDFIQAYVRVEASDIFNTLGKTNENIAIISNDLLKITRKINDGNGTIGMLLQDSLLALELQRSIANLRATTSHLNAISRKLNTVTTDISSGEGLLGTLIYDTIIMDRFQSMITRIDTELYGQVAATLAEVDATVAELKCSSENIADFSKDLKNISEEIMTGEGPISTLLRDTLVTQNMQETMKNLNEGTEKFKEDMEALQHNFLFRKYFKKLEKQAKKDAEANQ